MKIKEENRILGNVNRRVNEPNRIENNKSVHGLMISVEIRYKIDMTLYKNKQIY